MHPSWREIDERSSAWLDRFGVYSDRAQRERLTRISVGEITSRGAPSGRGAALPWTSDFLTTRRSGSTHPGSRSSRPSARSSTGTTSPRPTTHHDIRGFVEIFASITGWSSDLVSYHKERQRSQEGYGNIVNLIVYERQRTLDEAVSETAMMHTLAMALYLRLRDQILRDAGPELRRWITDCDSWIRADYDWSLTTHRYVNPENPADLPVGSATSPFHEREADQPLPIASIAWWWTLVKDESQRASDALWELPSACVIRRYAAQARLARGRQAFQVSSRCR
ncbi:hypothetical protein AB0D13_30600 [Streptomyces sp. NPDC048430]|uniref:terpene synthase family protein n=1 Tax=Streptomyces sp. NPDC048430 TaxID=3155388 RepID=UPI0034159229